MEEGGVCVNTSVLTDKNEGCRDGSTKKDHVCKGSHVKNQGKYTCANL